MQLVMPALLCRPKSQVGTLLYYQVHVADSLPRLRLSASVHSLVYEDALNGWGIREKAARDRFREFCDEETSIPVMLESLNEAATEWLNDLRLEYRL